jgi:signal transduction histidine kinase
MPRRIGRSTFGLVAAVALGLIIATLGIGIVAIRVTHEALEQQLEDRVETETASLLDEAREDGMPGLAEDIRRREGSKPMAGLGYLLLDVAGGHVAGAMVPIDAVREGYEEHFRYLHEGKPDIAQALATPVAGGILVVAADRDELASIDRTMTTLLLWSLAAMLVAGIGSAALIGLATRRRIARIETTARAIIGGEFTRRVARDGSDSEFDRLASVLNQMLDRIGGLMENLRQLSSDVAHDLRTPLTRLYNSLDRALAEPDAGVKAQRIEAARGQAAELLEIFSAILRIAEVEGMSVRLPRQPLDLSLLVEQMAESYRPDMDDSGHVFHCEVEPGIRFDGDRRLLSQAIANLLDNALRHTPPGTRVTLSARQAAGSARITVEDDGPGVEASELGRLFQRFARSERSRTTPGHGLGLALVAAVAAAHGGTAAIDNANGFRVILDLPYQTV